MASNRRGLTWDEIDKLLGQIGNAGFNIHAVVQGITKNMADAGLTENHRRAAMSVPPRAEVAPGGGRSAFATQTQSWSPFMISRAGSAMRLPLGASNSAGSAAGLPLGASNSAGSAAGAFRRIAPAGPPLSGAAPAGPPNSRAASAGLPNSRPGSALPPLSRAGSALSIGRQSSTRGLLAAASAPLGISAAGLTNYRKDEQKYYETNFITRLLVQPNLNMFIREVVYAIIDKCRSVGFPDADIKKCLQVHYAEKPSMTYIKAIGLLEREAADILSATTFDQFNAKCNSHKITFMQLMGAVFNFEINPHLIQKLIEADPAQKEKFMAGVRKQLFLPPTVSYETFKAKYLGKQDLYTWIWNYFTTDIKNLFTINQHRALNTAKADKTTFDSDPSCMVPGYPLASSGPKQAKYMQIKKLLGTLHGRIIQPIAGNVFSAPADNIWRQLMEEYEKEVISGPSGSSSVLYYFMFETAKILNKSEKNMVMMLLCGCAHYALLFHSLTETLQTYIPCIQSVFPDFLPYDLGKNDVDYILQLVRDYIDEELYNSIVGTGISKDAWESAVAGAKRSRAASGSVALAASESAGSAASGSAAANDLGDQIVEREDEGCAGVGVAGGGGGGGGGGAVDGGAGDRILTHFGTRIVGTPGSPKAMKYAAAATAPAAAYSSNEEQLAKARRANNAGTRNPGNKGGGRKRVHKRRTRRHRKK